MRFFLISFIGEDGTPEALAFVNDKVGLVGNSYYMDIVAKELLYVSDGYQVRIHEFHEDEVIAEVPTPYLIQQEYDPEFNYCHHEVIVANDDFLEGLEELAQ